VARPNQVRGISVTYIRIALGVNVPSSHHGLILALCIRMGSVEPCLETTLVYQAVAEALSRATQEIMSTVQES